jgi:hypothetical protein
MSPSGYSYPLWKNITYEMSFSQVFLHIIKLLGLPGLTHHAGELIKVIDKGYKDVHRYFNEENIQIEIIIAEWVFSLFSSAIPLDIQINFYFGFFGEGWEFFYKMCLSVILNIYDKRGTYTDVADVYIAFKLGKHHEKATSEINKIWNNLIDKAFQIQI